MARSAIPYPRQAGPYANLTFPVLTGRDNSVYAYPDPDSPGDFVLYSRKSADTTILQKSTDFGSSWSDVYDFTYNVGIVIVTANGNILVGQKSDSDFFADPPAQLYLSTDGGSTFNSVLTLTSGGFESFSYDVYGDTVFVGEYGKYNATHAYRSTDGGANWSTVFTHPVDGSSTVHIHKLHIDNVTPTTIYLSAGDSTPAKGIWYSTDNGDTWSVISRSHQPTWMETDSDYLFLGEDLEGKIHRIAKSRLSEGDAALEEVYNAQQDGRGSFGNISFYSGGTTDDGNDPNGVIIFGGVAYGVNSSQNNTKDAPLVASVDQGKTWGLIQSFKRQLTVSSGYNVISQPAYGHWLIRTNNTSKVMDVDGDAVKNALLAGLQRDLSGNLVEDGRKTYRNLVPNGDFELEPPDNSAATTGTATRWIDGTAAGSQAAMSVYRWAIPTGGYAGTAEAQITGDVAGSDLHAISRVMRLSNTNTTGAISVATYRNAVPKEYFNMESNTSYTLKAWIKTNNAPTNGAYIDVREFTSAGATNTTRSTTKLAGTNDWQELTLTFTTGATTKLGAVLLRLNVVGNVCDAWFDNIRLYKTTTTRPSIP